LAPVYSQQALDCYVEEGCANDNTAAGDFVLPDVNSTTSSLGCIYGGTYVNVQLTEGTVIDFDTCTSTWDSQMTIFSGIEDYPLAYNDDTRENCGTAGTGSYIRFIAPWTGTFRIVIDRYWCSDDPNECADLTATYIETITLGPKNVTGGACPDDLDVNDDDQVTVPYTVGSSEVIACVNPGQGIRVWLNHNSIMEFDTCRFSGFDTQLTVYSERTDALVTYSDDSCGCVGRAARVRVETTVQQSYFRLHVDKFDCATDDTTCVYINATLIAAPELENNSSFATTIASSSLLVALLSFFF
jgi:hypothetical protein